MSTRKSSCKMQWIEMAASCRYAQISFITFNCRRFNWMKPMRATSIAVRGCDGSTIQIMLWSYLEEQHASIIVFASNSPTMQL